MLLLTLAFAVCLLSVGNAQGRFPIQVYPILTPPYSLRLSDYAQFGSQRLVINVQVQDATITNLPVRLHIKFENFNGSSIENIPNFPIQPIYLNGGETRIFFGEDLAPYFNPDNLIFNGYSREQYRRTGQLPEGYYRVTAQIRHYYTNRLISNIGFTSAHFALGKPPILISPDNEVELGNIQGAPLTFSWQNSRTIIPGANVQYKFEMWELRLPGINPYVYVNSMPPFYTEQSFMSPLQIYPAMHNFEPGMKYAWRVTAGDIMDLVPFEQDGKSEVRTFTFMSKCDPPANLKVEQKSRDAVYSWTPNTNHTSYTVEAEDITTGTQRSYTTYDNRYTLQELDYGHEYRARVRAICNGNDFHPSDFTEWVKFTLTRPPNPQDSCPECTCEDIDKSKIPPVTNQELRRDLKKGDIIYRPSTETRFEIITAKEVGNGVYEGQFYFMLDIYGGKVLANYKNLQVNTDNIVLKGLKFKTVKTFGFVANVDAIEDALDGDDGDENSNNNQDNNDIPHDTVITNFDLPDNPQITYNDSTGQITLTDENGNNPIIIDLPKDENGNINFPVTVVDDNGDTYIVTKDENGSVNIEKQEQGQQQDEQIPALIKPYYLIEGHKFYNGETIYLPVSNNTIKIKGYQDSLTLFNNSSVWTGFNSKIDSATYAFIPKVISTDIKGTVLSTTFLKNHTLKCNVVVLDANIEESPFQSYGFDANTIDHYYQHETFNGKNIAWKSILIGSMGSDWFHVKTTPQGLNSQIDFNKGFSDNISHYRNHEYSFSTSQTTIHYIHTKVNKFNDNIQRVGIWAFDGVRDKSLGIIYVDLIKSDGTIEYAGDIINIPCSTDDLKLDMNKVYNSAGINFERVEVVGRVPIAFDLNGNGFLDAPAASAPEYKMVLDSVWEFINKNDDPYTYYTIVVRSLSRNSTICGMGFGLIEDDPKHERVILATIDANRAKITFTNTCAHELGHSAFGLKHPFKNHDPSNVKSSYGDGGADPENFMDYKDGLKSRKYQWVLIWNNDKRK
jgi:hypothetical protein